MSVVRPPQFLPEDERTKRRKSRRAAKDTKNERLYGLASRLSAMMGAPQWPMFEPTANGWRLRPRNVYTGWDRIANDNGGVVVDRRRNLDPDRLTLRMRTFLRVVLDFEHSALRGMPFAEDFERFEVLFHKARHRYLVETFSVEGRGRICLTSRGHRLLRLYER